MASKKKTTNKKAGMSGAEKVGIGIGLTTAAVAAAGAYFLYSSPNAAKNRKKVKGWMLKAKGEVLEAMENAKQMSEEEFNSLVGTVTGAYETMSHVSKADVKEFKKEMGEHWQKLAKTMTPKKKTAKKPVKKVAKKVAKKTEDK